MSFTARSLILLFVLAAVIAAARLHTYDEPLDRDVTLYAVIAHELLAGRELYSDLWDHKPPGIFAIYAAAERVVGYGRRSVYLLNVAGAIVTLVGVWCAGTLAAGRFGAAAAAVLWTIVSGDPLLEANQPNAEVFLNAASVWAFVATLQARQGRRHARSALATIMAAASLVKHVAVFQAAALALASGRDTKERVRAVVLTGATGAGAWLLTLAYFAATGRNGDFVRAVLETNVFYVRDAFGAHLPITNAGVALTVLTAGMCSLACAATRSAAARLALVAWTVGCLAALISAGRFFPHYFQLLMPPLAVSAGMVAEWLRSRRGGAVVVWAALALAATHEGRYFFLPARQWSEMKYGRVFIDATEAAHHASKLLPPGPLYAFANEPAFYFDGRRRPATGPLLQYHVTIGPQAGELTARVLRDLRRHAPVAIVVSETVPHDHPIMQWIRSHYRAQTSHAGYSLLVRLPARR